MKRKIIIGVFAIIWGIAGIISLSMTPDVVHAQIPGPLPPPPPPPCGSFMNGGPGDDTIVCYGVFSGDYVAGDYDSNPGANAYAQGNDTITNQPGVTGLSGNIYGDWADSMDYDALAGGNDTITNNGDVWWMVGDYATSMFASVTTLGDDVIVNQGQADSIYGDRAQTIYGNATASGNDVITNNGTLETMVGDQTSSWGGSNAVGNDRIVNNGTVTVIYGDQAFGEGSATAGGNDTIINSGSATGIHGDYGSAYFGEGITNGADTIINQGDIWWICGDSAHSDYGNATASGADIITNSGVVYDSIYGDYAQAGIAGSATANGADTITNRGTVRGSIYGDYANSELQDAIANGNDTITNYGTVRGDIYGDYAEGVTATTGGDDTISNYGTVWGGIYAGGGDDTVIIYNGAPVHGLMNGGAGTDELRFEFVSSDYAALPDLAFLQALAAANPRGGKVFINGNMFTWRNFEELASLMRLLARCYAWPVQVFYPDAITVTVWGPLDAENGFQVAEIDRTTLTRDPAGPRFELPETSQGWYVLVPWVMDHYEIHVFDAESNLLTDRCWFSG